jgi:predicted hotdog family 3-hydroxylacyl-ACP dehydratase
MTGHTLGAAGALEAAFCWLSLSAEKRSSLAAARVGRPGRPDCRRCRWVTASERLTSDPLPDEQFVCLRRQQRQPDYRRRPMIDWPLAELLPHAGDMILIEQILASMKSRSTPASPSSPTACSANRRQPAGLGRHRTDGPERRRLRRLPCAPARQPVALGFLLGSASRMQRRAFPAGTELTIHGLRSLEDDNGMGVFECHINAPAFRPAPVERVPPAPAGQYLEQTRESNDD